MEQLLAPTLMEWLTGIGFCLAYVAGMQALACAASICRICQQPAASRPDR
jgi:hypothetical protein